MQLSLQGLRYLAVVVMGLGIDLGLALALAGMGAPRPVASAAGLLAGAAFNFALHRAWTFRSENRRPVTGQLLRYAVSLAAMFALRLAVLTALALASVGATDAVALVLATGASFVANFVFLKRLVFNERADP